jgi:hypothetical protein
LYMLKIVTGLYRGWGRFRSWQALRMAWYQTILSMQMAEVIRVMYWVIVMVALGSVAKMAC